MYSIDWLSIAIVGMSDKSKPVAVLPTPYWCVFSCGGVDEISPEGSRVYQDMCNSFSMFALQLKVYYSSLVATFNQFSLHRQLIRWYTSESETWRNGVKWNNAAFQIKYDEAT